MNQPINKEQVSNSSTVNDDFAAALTELIIKCVIERGLFQRDALPLISLFNTFLNFLRQEQEQKPQISFSWRTETSIFGKECSAAGGWLLKKIVGSSQLATALSNWSKLSPEQQQYQAAAPIFNPWREVNRGLTLATVFPLVDNFLRNLGNFSLSKVPTVIGFGAAPLVGPLLMDSLISRFLAQYAANLSEEQQQQAQRWLGVFARCVLAAGTPRVAVTEDGAIVTQYPSPTGPSITLDHGDRLMELNGKKVTLSQVSGEMVAADRTTTTVTETRTFQFQVEGVDVASMQQGLILHVSTADGVETNLQFSLTSDGELSVQSTNAAGAPLAAHWQRELNQRLGLSNHVAPSPVLPAAPSLASAPSLPPLVSSSLLAAVTAYFAGSSASAGATTTIAATLALGATGATLLSSVAAQPTIEVSEQSSEQSPALANVEALRLALNRITPKEPDAAAIKEALETFYRGQYPDDRLAWRNYEKALEYLLFGNLPPPKSGQQRAAIYAQMQALNNNKNLYGGLRVESQKFLKLFLDASEPLSPEREEQLASEPPWKSSAAIKSGQWEGLLENLSAGKLRMVIAQLKHYLAGDDNGKTKAYLRGEMLSNPTIFVSIPELSASVTHIVCVMVSSITDFNGPDSQELVSALVKAAGQFFARQSSPTTFGNINKQLLAVVSMVRVLQWYQSYFCSAAAMLFSQRVLDRMIRAYDRRSMPLHLLIKYLEPDERVAGAIEGMTLVEGDTALCARFSNQPSTQQLCELLAKIYTGNFQLITPAELEWLSPNTWSTFVLLTGKPLSVRMSPNTNQQVEISPEMLFFPVLITDDRGDAAIQELLQRSLSLVTSIGDKARATLTRYIAETPLQKIDIGSLLQQGKYEELYLYCLALISAGRMEELKQQINADPETMGLSWLLTRYPIEIKKIYGEEKGSPVSAAQASQNALKTYQCLRLVVLCHRVGLRTIRFNPSSAESYLMGLSTVAQQAFGTATFVENPTQMAEFSVYYGALFRDIDASRQAINQVASSRDGENMPLPHELRLGLGDDIRYLHQILPAKKEQEKEQASHSLVTMMLITIAFLVNSLYYGRGWIKQLLFTGKFNFEEFCDLIRNLKEGGTSLSLPIRTSIIVACDSGNAVHAAIMQRIRTARIPIELIGSNFKFSSQDINNHMEKLFAICFLPGFEIFSDHFPGVKVTVAKEPPFLPLPQFEFPAGYLKDMKLPKIEVSEQKLRAIVDGNHLKFVPADANDSASQGEAKQETQSVSGKEIALILFYLNKFYRKHYGISDDLFVFNQEKSNFTWQEEIKKQMSANNYQRARLAFLILLSFFNYYVPFKDATDNIVETLTTRLNSFYSAVGKCQTEVKISLTDSGSFEISRVPANFLAVLKKIFGSQHSSDAASAADTIMIGFAQADAWSKKSAADFNNDLRNALSKEKEQIEKEKQKVAQEQRRREEDAKELEKQKEALLQQEKLAKNRSAFVTVLKEFFPATARVSVTFGEEKITEIVPGYLMEFIETHGIDLVNFNRDKCKDKLQQSFLDKIKQQFCSRYKIDASQVNVTASQIEITKAKLSTELSNIQKQCSFKRCVEKNEKLRLIFSDGTLSEKLQPFLPMAASQPKSATRERSTAPPRERIQDDLLSLSGAAQGDSSLDKKGKGVKWVTPSVQGHSGSSSRPRAPNVGRSNSTMRAGAAGSSSASLPSRTSSTGRSGSTIRDKIPSRIFADTQRRLSDVDNAAIRTALGDDWINAADDICRSCNQFSLTGNLAISVQELQDQKRHHRFALLGVLLRLFVLLNISSPSIKHREELLDVNRYLVGHGKDLVSAVRNQLAHPNRSLILLDDRHFNEWLAILANIVADLKNKDNGSSYSVSGKIIELINGFKTIDEELNWETVVRQLIGAKDYAEQHLTEFSSSYVAVFLLALMQEQKLDQEARNKITAARNGVCHERDISSYLGQELATTFGLLDAGITHDNLFAATAVRIQAARSLSPS